MKPTPITDEIIRTLHAATEIFDLLPKAISDIKAGGKRGEMVAKSLNEGVKWRLDSLNDCTATIDDVRREWWELCQGVETLPEYTAILGTRFEAANIPADIVELMEANDEAYSDLWELGKGDVVGGLTMIASQCWLWVEAVRALIADLRQMYDNSQRERQRQAGGSGEPKQLPDELQSDEAIAILGRGISGGLLNTDYQPQNGTTQYQLKEFADLASDVLHINNKWKVFGCLWGIKNMGQIRTTEAKTDQLQAVRKLFPEVGYDADGCPPKPKGFTKL